MVTCHAEGIAAAKEAVVHHVVAKHTRIPGVEVAADATGSDGITMTDQRGGRITHAADNFVGGTALLVELAPSIVCQVLAEAVSVAIVLRIQPVIIEDAISPEAVTGTAPIAAGVRLPLTAAVVAVGMPRKSVYRSFVTGEGNAAHHHAENSLIIPVTEVAG